MPTSDEFKRRQRILADFGEFALRCENLQDILMQACRLIADALGTDRAKVLQIERDDDYALLRAGVGWAPGIVGNMRIPLNERSSEAHAIEVARPVAVQDIGKEDRFELPAFMREAGVIAFVNVPIFLPGGTPFGLLQVDACEPREFGGEDIEFLRTYAAILGPVIDRLHKVRDLEKANDRNAILLRELQHRVKNDLAVIRVMVGLRAKRGSPEVRKELQIVQERIDTLSLLHNQLSTERTDRLALRPYFQKLMTNLRRLHHDDASNVQVDIEVADLAVSRDIAGRLGLILNEFTTNSFKYAFNGSGGVLTVRIDRLDEQRASLYLHDNGVGFSDVQNSGSKSGMGLISALARAIDATPQWSSEDGVQLRMCFRYC